MEEPEKEECINCFGYTEMSGKGEDSIYVQLKKHIFKGNAGEYGPLCEECYDSLAQLDWIEKEEKS